MNDACSGEAMAMFEDLDQAIFFNECRDGLNLMQPIMREPHLVDCPQREGDGHRAAEWWGIAEEQSL